MKGLVVGLANDKSIAWGCVKAFAEQGADLAITYRSEKTKTYTAPLVETVKAPIFLPLDVTNESHLDELFQAIESHWGELDFLVHSIAFALQQDLQNPLIDSSAEGFKIAMDISCHSLMRLSKRAAPLMKKGGSIITMSYYGSERVVENYHFMGPVKAALESSVRCLAQELGSKKIRVNAISPGPIMTRAASGLSHFDQLMEKTAKNSPLQQPISIEKVGQMAAFLVSDKSENITGQVIHVDNGYSIMG
jgi:enoyl-[acyl-carrier protein] reductase I